MKRLIIVACIMYNYSCLDSINDARLSKGYRIEISNMERVTDVLISAWVQFVNLKVNGHRIAVYRNQSSCIMICIIFLIHDSDVSKILTICIKIF